MAVCLSAVRAVTPPELSPCVTIIASASSLNPTSSNLEEVDEFEVHANEIPAD